MFGIERCDDDAAERSIPVEEPPCELHGPFLAGAADDGLADKQAVIGAIQVRFEVLAVAEIDQRGGLWAGV